MFIWNFFSHLNRNRKQSGDTVKDYEDNQGRQRQLSHSNGDDELAFFLELVKSWQCRFYTKEAELATVGGPFVA